MTNHNDDSNDLTIVELATDLETVCRRIASGNGGADSVANMIEDRDDLATALTELPARDRKGLAAKTHAASVLLTTAGSEAAQDLYWSVLIDLAAFLAGWWE